MCAIGIGKVCTLKVDCNQQAPPPGTCDVHSFPVGE